MRKNNSEHFVRNEKTSLSGLTCIHSANEMFCVPCRSFEKSGPLVEGTDNSRTDAMKSHDDSVTHVTTKRNYDIKHCPSSTTYVTSFPGNCCLVFPLGLVKI